MAAPSVTIIVSPRDRFSMTEESLESLYAHTTTPFNLIYVDGFAPPAAAAYLRKQASERDFRLIRVDHYLSPNEARNIGLKHADTPYVVFVDNDVIYTDGWLDALIACAEETGASVVTPLICEGHPVHKVIHHAGGAFTDLPTADDFFAAADTPAGRKIIEVQNHHLEQLDDLQGKLSRADTGTCEFHCVLVRRDIFDTIGPLDERLKASKEHLDLSLNVHQAGGRIVFEPRSLVTFVLPCAGRPLRRGDREFFLLRWSDAWGAISLGAFRRKWKLEDTDFFDSKPRIYRWRRIESVVVPILQKIPLMGRSRRITHRLGRMLEPVECWVNRRLVQRHERRLAASGGGSGAQPPGAMTEAR